MRAGSGKERRILTLSRPFTNRHGRSLNIFAHIRGFEACWSNIQPRCYSGDFLLEHSWLCRIWRMAGALTCVGGDGCRCCEIGDDALLMAITTWLSDTSIVDGAASRSPPFISDEKQPFLGMLTRSRRRGAIAHPSLTGRRATAFGSTTANSAPTTTAP